MISALSRIHRQEQVLLSVGQKEIGLISSEGKVTERKVPLPEKWIRGLSTVQIFLSEAEKGITLSRMQALQLFQTLPNGSVKTDYYLLMRGNRPIFSAVKAVNAICVGGLHRLKLMEPLVALADRLEVYAHPDMQSTTWQLYFGDIRFSLTLSRDAWRGFSGEGAALESLIEDIPDSWIKSFDNYSYANQAFNPALLAVSENLDLSKIENMTGRLSAMGMLGYDVEEKHFFYRRLPFKLSRILSMNPRLKDAEQLLADGKVQIVSTMGGRTEAMVTGSGVNHTVIIDETKERCTCTWYSRHQGERGPFKHMLAVKKKITS
jgi:hypothetical protein